MLAILSSLAIFAAWTLIGLAFLAALRADLRNLRVVLTAPALGSAVAVAPLFVLSNAGFGMSSAAPPVWVALFVASAAVLAWRRPRLARGAAPVFLLALANLLIVGRPMLRFGFDWIANANGDMAYYVLSATHLMHHGLQSPIDTHALAANHDFASAAQGLSLRGLRPGTQIALAAIAGSVGTSAVAAYMPMALALSMTAVCATGALAMQGTARRGAAIVAAALFTVAALAGYGVLQQLTPQEWGLTLGAALLAWLMRPELYQARPPAADLAVIATLAAALFVVAYEVASALAPAYALYVGLLVLRRRISIRAVAVLWVIPLAVTGLVVNTFLPRALGYLNGYVLHFGTSSGLKGITLFGYAIVPTALPGAVGFRSLFAPPTARYMEISVIAALFFFVFVVAAACWIARHGAAAGITVLADLILGAWLAAKSNDFGLFKLYMYMQPFVAATLAIALVELRSRRLLAVGSALLAVAAGAQAVTLAGYIHRSMHPIDLRDASKPQLLPAFRQMLSSARVPFVTETDNLPLEQLEGSIAGNKQIFFFGRNGFGLPWTQRAIHVPTSQGRTLLTFQDNVAASRVLSSGHCTLVLPTGSQLALNRRVLPDGSPDLVQLPCKPRRNLLAFVVSSKGQAFSLPDDRLAVSFWQLEKDPAFPGTTFSGFGRYALFQVFGPSRTVRLALTYTTSPTNSPTSTYDLPPAAVVGARRVRFPVIGSGSARVFSPPVRPMVVGGRRYVVLDMGRAGELPVVARPGITALWGNSVVLDPRALTSYVRDVSVVTESQYRRLRPPRAIRAIPRDIEKADLAYSGVFEDGWVGRAAYVDLAGGPRTKLGIDLQVLPRPDQHLRVLVDGRQLYDAAVHAGTLDLRLPSPASTHPRRVKILFDGVVHLTAPDQRSAAARLTFLGATGTQPAVALPASISSFPADLRRLRHTGVWADGWLARDASADLAGGSASLLRLRASVPERSGGQHVDVLVNGQSVLSKDVGPGDLDVEVPVPASSGARRIELRWRRTIKLHAPDTRHAAALLELLSMTPMPPPPRRVSSFPDDLKHVSSKGIYDDGWLAADSYAVLAGGPAATLTVRAMVPPRPRGQHLDVVVNGRRVATKTVKPGDLALSVPLPAAAQSRKVELRWAGAVKLKAPDNRHAAALLKELRITPS